jgi:hypothetical protein
VALSTGASYRHTHNLLTRTISTEVFARSPRLPHPLMLDKPYAIDGHALSGIAFQNSSTRRDALLETLRRIR